MIDQLTVFLGNENGRLTALCKTLGDAQIQMHALTIADTSDYGIVRIICDDPESAKKVLADAGFTASLAKVLAIQVPDVPGGASNVFSVIDAAGASIEYAYCFTASVGTATLAVKVSGDVKKTLEDAGFTLLYPQDIYKK